MKVLSLFVTPKLAVLGLLLFATVSSAKQSRATARDLMDAELSVERLGRPNASIEARETSRRGTSGKDLMVTYRLYLKAPPLKSLLKVSRLPVGEVNPKSLMTGVSVAQDGLLVCGGKLAGQCGNSTKTDAPLDFVVTARKGEPFRLTFGSKELQVGTVLIPDPVTVTDRACTLNALRLTPSFDLAMISGSGFSPNTTLHYQLNSQILALQSDAKGAFAIAVAADSKRAPTGITIFKINETQCSPELWFQWGS